MATEDQLLLARAICSYEIDESRTEYGRKPDVETLTPSGRLHLGDCCGIIYLHSGVCHQMANRICAAATAITNENSIAIKDVTGAADTAMYEYTHNIWEPFGRFNDSVPREIWDQVYDAFSGQFTLADDQLRELGIYQGSTDEAVGMLYKPWPIYLQECQKLVDEYKRRKTF